MAIRFTNAGGSMRILITTAGSRGDAVPCTGLGARLREAGQG